MMLSLFIRSLADYIALSCRLIQFDRIVMILCFHFGIAWHGDNMKENSHSKRDVLVLILNFLPEFTS